MGCTHQGYQAKLFLAHALGRHLSSTRCHSQYLSPSLGYYQHTMQSPLPPHMSNAGSLFPPNGSHPGSARYSGGSRPLDDVQQDIHASQRMFPGDSRVPPIYHGSQPQMMMPDPTPHAMPYHPTDPHLQSPAMMDEHYAPNLYPNLEVSNNPPLEQHLDGPPVDPRLSIEPIPMPHGPGDEPFLAPPPGTAMSYTYPPGVRGWFQRWLSRMGINPYHNLSPGADHPKELQFPWLYQYYLIICIALCLILLVVVALLLYLALSKHGQPCGPACLGVGKPGLYLTGFGQAQELTLLNNTCKTHASSDVYYAAMNYEQYGQYDDLQQSPVCGKCIRVYGPAGTVQAKLVDRCEGCSYGGLALSTPAFRVVSDTDHTGVPVRWEGC
ncbi:hypothetical protein IWQ61_005814 [Dispira simplex]|nr:hypothetical protein IWQ61_005814 [Dispira simplex]